MSNTKIPLTEISNIIDAFEINLVPVQQLADHYSVSRISIYKLLKRNGIDTTKRRILVSCDVCGKEHLRPRCQIRDRKHIFCSTDCYYSYLAAIGGNYVERRQGMRMARTIVSKYFNLQSGHVVHHEDGNQYNNAPTNLRVFLNNGDHIRYHHQQRSQRINFNNHYDLNTYYPITPLWDGSKLS